MSDEIGTIKATLEKAREAACVLSWINFGCKIEEALAALAAIDPDAIRRECADKAVDWYTRVLCTHEGKLTKGLHNYILGTEPAHEAKP